MSLNSLFEEYQANIKPNFLLMKEKQENLKILEKKLREARENFYGIKYIFASKERKQKKLNQLEYLHSQVRNELNDLTFSIESRTFDLLLTNKEYFENISSQIFSSYSGFSRNNNHLWAKLDDEVLEDPFYKELFLFVLKRSREERNSLLSTLVSLRLFNLASIVPQNYIDGINNFRLKRELELMNIVSGK